ncbi:hypothetical protein ABMA28_016238 [Loxostege sticticalis]|uniref:Uncharacterized protein n=1 Tax=Loxostege sticticalis TaxID=481309 RepID=A0ABD0T8C7_LOXSC
MFRTIIWLFILFRDIQGRMLPDISDFNTVTHLNKLVLKPAIHYFDGSEINEITDAYVYKVTLPGHGNNDEELKKANENNYNFMGKSKQKTIDIGPYALIQRLDEMKYMVLWLNLYCGMHPDCDKIKLNEELLKEVSIKNSQVIKVPDLDCPRGQRRDWTGYCRIRF